MITPRDRWASILADFSSSGLTIDRFCQRRGLALSTFHFWRRRLRDDGAHSSHAVPLVELRDLDRRPADVAPHLARRRARRHALRLRPPR